MVITTRELMQFTPKNIKTVGSYHIVDNECRKAYCKCKVHNGDWVSGCRTCGRRIRP